MVVVGDPAGMRSAAAQLRFRAEQFGRLAVDVDGGVAGMSFAGPAAVRWRAAVADQGVRLRTAAARLAEAADLLVRNAAWVEEEQARELLIEGM
jgi:hypothetical protein